MPDIVTRHAAMRMAQRSMDLSDIQLVASLGTEVESGYLFREKDFHVADRELKRQRQRLRRLVGKRVVVRDGEVVVTTYHAERSTVRRLLHRA